MDNSSSSSADSALDLSVIIPVTERLDDILELYAEYTTAVREFGLNYEMIFLIDGNMPAIVDQLRQKVAQDEHLKVVALPRAYGEATALAVGLDHAVGEYVLTLPAYRQVNAGDLHKLIEIRNEADVVVGNRFPRADGTFNQLQTKAFSYFANKISGLSLADAGCTVRLVRRDVLGKIELYGDFHRFIPLLAHRQGFTVVQADVGQSQHDQTFRMYAPGVYLRRFLDLFSIYFLIRFTRKPFRLFGLIGSVVMLIGTATAGVMVAQRAFFDVGLNDRPLLVISALMILFGMQILALGLIGEIVIFSNSSKRNEYSIKEIIQSDAAKPNV